MIVKAGKCSLSEAFPVAKGVGGADRGKWGWKVHLEDLRDRQIYRMSGGQKKLAALATILSMQPQIMLLDEPSIALDPRNRRNLIAGLNEIKVTKVIASHDLDMVLDTCERTLLLFGGKIVRDGKTEEILRDRQLLEENGLELPLRLQA